MVAADVYKMSRGLVVHTARAFGTSKKLMGSVLNPQSWKNLMNIAPKAVSKQEIIATLNSKGGPGWERFKLALYGLRNSALNMRGTKPSVARNIPSEIQLELKDLLTPPAAGAAVKGTDVASRVKISQLLEENFVKSRLTDLERAIVSSGLGSYFGARSL